MTTEISHLAAPESGARAGIELNGLNTIAESERHGRARDLFWPWFAANVSVLGLGYCSFLLGFGISFWQAALVGLIGIVMSFALCGFVALSGKRGSAPTMVLSRAAFGGYANLGVIVALLVGFLGTLLLGRGAVRRQEAAPDAERRPVADRTLA